MLESQLNSLRFSREYATLLLRHMRGFVDESSYPENLENYDLNQLNQLTRNLLLSANNKEYGLTIGRALHICEYGAVGYAAMSSSTLLDALQTTIRYRNLLMKGLWTQLDKRPEGYLYSVHCSENHPALHPLIELELAAGLRFAKLVLGSDKAFPLEIKRASIQHCPLSSIQHYSATFGCPPAFNSGCNALLIDAESLLQSTQSPNPIVHDVLSQKLESSAAIKGAQVSFTERVRAYFGSTLPKHAPTQEEVAEHFCLSVSGLKSRLRKEGDSFRNILDEERFRIAEQQLRHGQMSIKEISYGLGFSEQSAFNRAFKRWSGSNPKDYRTTDKALSVC